MRFILTLAFLLIFSALVNAQSSAVTEFKDNHETSLAMYFYPSTLRMINLNQNLEFNEMIREIKKARFFRLDSGAVTPSELSALSESLIKSGYEEMMVMKSPDIDIAVLGLEKHIPEFVVISRKGDECMLLEVAGILNIAKIPKLMDAFNNGGFLDVLNLKNKKNDGSADH
ncbi:MAG: DUF4252 domain-containing protein [Cyclobacteriaceae bacterium]|nr:DUF4252 domain-containing protein [Cyclobacteriaceae bacterium]